MVLRLKEILRSKKVTVISLAVNVGMTQPNMSNIVNGKTQPSLPTLQKIADVLNIELWELFTERKTGELTGVIEYKGVSYVAHSVAELEKIVAELKTE